MRRHMPAAFCFARLESDAGMICQRILCALLSPSDGQVLVLGEQERIVSNQWVADKRCDPECMAVLRRFRRLVMACGLFPMRVA